MMPDPTLPLRYDLQSICTVIPPIALVTMLCFNHAVHSPVSASHAADLLDLLVEGLERHLEVLGVVCTTPPQCIDTITSVHDTIYRGFPRQGSNDTCAFSYDIQYHDLPPSMGAFLRKGNRSTISSTVASSRFRLPVCTHAIKHNHPLGETLHLFPYTSSPSPHSTILLSQSPMRLLSIRQSSIQQLSMRQDSPCNIYSR
jgi:hypothetical protein